MKHETVFDHDHVIVIGQAAVSATFTYHCQFTVEAIFDGDAQTGYEAHLVQVDVSATFDNVIGLSEMPRRAVFLRAKNSAEMKFRALLEAECLAVWRNL